MKPESEANKKKAITPVGSGTLLSLASATFNIGIPIAAWYAVNGNAPAGNIVKLLAAVTALLCPFVFLTFLHPGEPTPRWREWMSHISDGITVSILVWHGWLWCSLSFTIGWIAACAMFTAKRTAARLNDQAER